MIASRSVSETGVWVTDEGVTIEYSLAALDDIRRLAVDGLNAFGHGGLEIGGVLHGTREGRRILVASFAEAACEHALGPGFVLSDKDRAAFEALLHASPGLEVVGWYRSHTRGTLNLDGHDCQMFDRFFAGVRTVGLTVKPTARGPASAAFFVREPSGEIRPMAAREFPLEPLGPLRVAPPEISAPPLPAPEPEPAVVDTSSVLAAKPVARRRIRAIWWALSAAFVALCIFTAWKYWPRVVPPKLILQAYAVAPGQVRIEWDRQSPEIREGRSGVLRIDDGDAGEVVLLDTAQLRASSITYTQHTDHISVRLRVDSRGRAPAEGAVDFVGPVAPAPASPLVPRPAQAQAEADVEVSVVPVQPAAEGPPSRPVQRERKLLVPRQAAGPVAPPVLTVPAAPALTSPPSQPALPELLSVAVHPKPPAPQHAAAVYSGPRAGRLIWTGMLARRGVVEIDGTHVNLGSLTGAFPGVPVSFRALPAEFNRAGLMVYTNDPASNGHTEKPTKSNGWNNVGFQFDLARAGELVVLEAPNPSNEFKRIVLRNDARTCPVIIVDWTVKP